MHGPTLVALTEDLRELEHIVLDGVGPHLGLKREADLSTLHDRWKLKEIACNDDLVSGMSERVPQT